MLHEFITANREEIIARCRAKVASRSIPPPSDAEINHGVPLFLEQLVDALRSGTSGVELDRSAGQHGHDLLLQGFTVSQVVHDYGDVCQTITELAVEADVPIGADDFGTLNRCLDEGIAGAVTIYGRESEQRAAVKQHEEAGRSNERIAFMVHELRNLIGTAIVAFEVIKTGNVGVSGNTAAVLDRSLLGLRHLIDQSLNEVRMTTSSANRTPIVVWSFIEEVAASARLVADVRGITLIVGPVDDGLVIEGDRQVLAAVVTNLLQNAFKFTHPHTRVTLRVSGTVDRPSLADPRPPATATAGGRSRRHGPTPRGESWRRPTTPSCTGCEASGTAAAETSQPCTAHPGEGRPGSDPGRCARRLAGAVANR